MKTLHVAGNQNEPITDTVTTALENNNIPEDCVLALTSAANGDVVIWYRMPRDSASLLPCPFCGRRPLMQSSFERIKDDDEEENEPTKVFEVKCLCCRMARTGKYRHVDSAAFHWNRRESPYSETIIHEKVLKYADQLAMTTNTIKCREILRDALNMAIITDLPKGGKR